MSGTEPARPRARGFPWGRYWLVFAILLVLTILPVISVLVAGAIAGANGCALDEGSVHPCLVNGADWGEALYTMGVLGWLMLATLPLGGGALLVWLIILIIHRIAWRRRKTMP